MHCLDWSWLHFLNVFFVLVFFEGLSFKLQFIGRGSAASAFHSSKVRHIVFASEAHLLAISGV